MNNPPQLQFPPGISLERQGQTYVIFRNKREEIGGVALTETPLGDTQLRPYLAAGKENDCCFCGTANVGCIIDAPGSKTGPLTTRTLSPKFFTRRC